MNTLEPKLLKELNNADYDSLMGFRVRRILMICSNYDTFILEEDGQIETQIYKEYIDCFTIKHYLHHSSYQQRKHPLP